MKLMTLTKEILDLIVNSEGHDRRHCECEGCYYFWVTSVVFDGENLVELVVPKELDRNEYIHGFLITLNVKLAKGIKETLHSVFAWYRPVVRYV